MSSNTTYKRVRKGYTVIQIKKSLNIMFNELAYYDSWGFEVVSRKKAITTIGKYLKKVSYSKPLKRAKR